MLMAASLSVKLRTWMVPTSAANATPEQQITKGKDRSIPLKVFILAPFPPSPERRDLVERRLIVRSRNRFDEVQCLPVIGVVTQPISRSTNKGSKGRIARPSIAGEKVPLPRPAFHSLRTLAKGIPPNRPNCVCANAH